MPGGGSSIAATTSRFASAMSKLAPTSARTAGLTAAAIVPQYLYSEQTATRRELTEALAARHRR